MIDSCFLFCFGPKIIQSYNFTEETTTIIIVSTKRNFPVANVLGLAGHGGQKKNHRWWWLPMVCCYQRLAQFLFSWNNNTITNLNLMMMKREREKFFLLQLRFPSLSSSSSSICGFGDNFFTKYIYRQTRKRKRMIEHEKNWLIPFFLYFDLFIDDDDDHGYLT